MTKTSECVVAAVTNNIVKNTEYAGQIHPLSTAQLAHHFMKARSTKKFAILIYVDNEKILDLKKALRTIVGSKIANVLIGSDFTKIIAIDFNTKQLIDIAMSILKESGLKSEAWHQNKLLFTNSSKKSETECMS